MAVSFNGGGNQSTRKKTTNQVTNKLYLRITSFNLRLNCLYNKENLCNFLTFQNVQRRVYCPCEVMHHTIGQFIIYCRRSAFR